MPSLISKDDDLATSAPVIGFAILKLLKEKELSRVSIFELAREIKKRDKAGVRGVYYGMLFLYSLGLIEFHAPYVSLNNV